MRILFIYPDNTTAVGYNAGIGILSAILDERGHETKLLHVSAELGYPSDIPTIVNDIIQHDPGMICLSVTTPQWREACLIGQAVKVAAPATQLVIGGPHVTADPGGAMKEAWVDFACCGEGDIFLPELVHRLEQGLSVDGLHNLVHRRRGEVIHEPLGLFVEDLDSLPFDNRDIFDYEKIIETRTGWAEVIVARGCPFPCSYCFNQALFENYHRDLADCGVSLNKKQYVRRRSVDKTIEMLISLKQRYPRIKGFTFVDDILAIDVGWLQGFAKRYREEIGLPYACTSHPQLFNAEIARLLKDSGCKVVKMGVESGNPDIRKKVLRRSISNQQLIDVFALAQQAGLKPQAFNMIGVPGETLDQMMDTVRLNAQIKPYIVWLSTFIPYPGCLLYKECVESGIIDDAKMKSINSYRGESPLKDPVLSSLSFTKLRMLFRWHLNVCLANEGSSLYANAIEEFSALPSVEWEDGRVERKILVRDDEMDQLLRQKDVSHYIRKNYINIFWGREYDYDIS